MSDSIVETEVVAACSSLGYSDGAQYYREAECLETVKDLIRYLRKDDDSHEIRRALGQIKVLQTDFIPIIKYYSKDKELFDFTLRLLVNLTHPVVLLFHEELPEEKVTRQQYLQLISHQQAFKEAFADEKFWKIMTERLGSIFKKDLSEREEEESIMAERVLILVRNVLVVAASPEEEKRTDDDASIHDQVLWALHLSNFEDLLLYIASSSSEESLCMHVIEIVSLMLKEQDASLLANSGLQRLQSEKEKDESELMRIRMREATEKKQKIKKHYSARHSRFGGTYYVNNMKSISERTLITHKPISDVNSLSFDHCKKGKKISKNRLPMSDIHITRRSTLAIRLFLREFCVEFLNGAFNHLMKNVKDKLDRSKAEDHDESYYLWAMQFFLEFNRCQDFRVELITETLNVHSFHYIQTLLENHHEMMTVDKKKIPLWSRRMHRAIKAYKELLITLSFMDKSESERVRNSSHILKNKVFYVVEYRELCLIFLQNYDELKMSKGYLKDLIEANHVFLKLMEGLCSKQRHLVVENKGRKKKASNKTKSVPKLSKVELTEEQLIADWETRMEELLAVIKGESGELPIKIPFDSASDSPESDQKEEAIKQINLLLRRGVLDEAVSLLRASREVWPEGDVFCSDEPDPLAEIACLREIFMADINRPEEVHPPQPMESEHEDAEGVDSDAEAENTENIICEQEFEFVPFVRRFSHTKVMQAYSLIFKDFFNNSENINHCILRMFHRIAWDCKLVPIFFQASIFRVFQKIMDEPETALSQSVQDARRFIKFVIRKFVEVSQDNKKVFIEVLFWKTNKQALEIEEGYGSSMPSASSKRVNWSEEEENELRSLFEEFKNVKHETKDIVDLITENLINQNFTRRNVIRKLKDLGLIENIKELSRKTVRASIPWSDEEIAQLKGIVNQFLDTFHPIERIMDHILVKRPKKHVIDKIIELGLVSDRKALRKKRQRAAKRRNSRSRSRSTSSERSLQPSTETLMIEGEIPSDLNSESESEEVVSQDGNVSKNRNFPQLAPTPEIVLSHLNAALEAGFDEAINWIAELLLETADERETDGDMEPVPLFAMTSNCCAAMEDSKFLVLIKAVGIKPPANHEEMFWRIPSNLSVSDLKKRGQFLIKRGGVSLINNAVASPDSDHMEAPDMPSSPSPFNVDSNCSLDSTTLRNESADRNDRSAGSIELNSDYESDKENSILSFDSVGGTNASREQPSTKRQYTPKRFGNLRKKRRILSSIESDDESVSLQTSNDDDGHLRSDFKNDRTNSDFKNDHINSDLRNDNHIAGSNSEDSDRFGSNLENYDRGSSDFRNNDSVSFDRKTVSRKTNIISTASLLSSSSSSDDDDDVPVGARRRQPLKCIDESDDTE